MEKQEYNGWSNYATWRVQLEIVSDWVNYQLEERLADDEPITAEFLKDYVQVVVINDAEFGQEGSLAENYAMAFLDDVDWYELADHANNEIKNEQKYQKENQK